ncbi:MAG: WD40 repeat domain-containing protein [Candidatus Bathyarchaeales archaeon]
MKRKFLLILSLFALLFATLSFRFNIAEVESMDGIDPSKIYGIIMLWNNSMSVYDVAVSTDGGYIAAVNETGLYYFEWNVSTPKWWYSGTTFLSVAISGDGEYVVAGDNSGYLSYFNDSRATTGERSAPTWTSQYLGGQVERGTLDMSYDGEYVVVGGTGITIYYFAECTTRSGTAENPTWVTGFLVDDFYAVKISPNGEYVAAGGRNSSIEGFVVFYKDATTASGSYDPLWICRSYIHAPIIDLALSEDGYSVAAVDIGMVPEGTATLYYWANAADISVEPEPTWTRNVAFLCVDMSYNGAEVVAGTSPAGPCGLHFWANARERSGYNQAENWTRREGEIIRDVAISGNGGLIAAAAQAPDESNNTAYFFKSDGTLIANFDLPEFSPLVSMSGDGVINAVAGPGYDSLYVFQTLVDTTPPLIENVHQQPANDSVYPEDEVIVYAEVTDDLSGVKQVRLNYTYTNSTGTWSETVIMDKSEGNTYYGKIRALPFCTNVTYMIIAEDNFNNIITTEEMGQEYKYHVIPEFPTQLVLSLFTVATLLAAAIGRKRLFQKARN